MAAHRLGVGMPRFYSHDRFSSLFSESQLGGTSSLKRCGFADLDVVLVKLLMVWVNCASALPPLRIRDSLDQHPGSQPCFRRSLPCSTAAAESMAWNLSLNR